MSGSGWERAKNEWEWVKNEWEWAGVNGSEWECMGVGRSTVWYNLFYYCVFLSCHLHIQKESAFCDCLTVKELLAQDRRNI